MASRKQLPEPVVADQFWANRRHDAIVTTITTFNGTTLIDIRKNAMGRDGVLKPTPKGISVKITRLPDLVKAINKAMEKAQTLGLLDGEDKDGA